MEFEQRVAERTSAAVPRTTTAVPRTKIGTLVAAIEDKSIIEAIRKWHESNRTWERRYDMAIDLVQPLVGKDWMGVVNRDDARQREAGEIISMNLPSKKSNKR
jgi:hypothetical protein